VLLRCFASLQHAYMASTQTKINKIYRKIEGYFIKTSFLVANTKKTAEDFKNYCNHKWNNRIFVIYNGFDSKVVLQYGHSKGSWILFELSFSRVQNCWTFCTSILLNRPK